MRRCWFDYQPYQESRYREARGKRASFQANWNSSPATPKLLMKTCESFTKLESLSY